MGSGRNVVGSGDSASYSASQIEAVLQEIGVEVQGETVNDFIGYCPFHGNRDTPSFSVSKTHGSYICFNPSCYLQGTLTELIRKQLNCTEFQARRLIIKQGAGAASGFADRVRKA